MIGKPLFALGLFGMFRDFPDTPSKGAEEIAVFG